MSYDVTVGSQEFNYTYNMGPFFLAYGVHPLADLSGLSRESAMIAISSALYLLSREDHEELRNKYDAPNGWGDVEGATRFLFNIYMACFTAEYGDTVEAT